jgi:hypothetical protein
VLEPVRLLALALERQLPIVRLVTKSRTGRMPANGQKIFLPAKGQMRSDLPINQKFIARRKDQAHSGLLRGPARNNGLRNARLRGPRNVRSRLRRT